jgi:hypothetical protein
MSPARIRTAAWLCAASLALAAPGCREAAPGAGEAEETVTRRPIAEVIAARADSLMAIPGVVGVYEGLTDDGAPCLKIMVVHLDDALRSRLPRTLDGYPVVLVQTGEIREMPAPRGPAGGTPE